MNARLIFTVGLLAHFTFTAAYSQTPQLVFDDTNGLSPAVTYPPVDGTIGQVIKTDPGPYAITRVEFTVDRQGHAGTADFQLFLYQVDSSSLASADPHVPAFWESGILDDVALSGDPQTISIDVPWVPVNQLFMWGVSATDKTDDIYRVGYALSDDTTVPNVGQAGGLFVKSPSFGFSRSSIDYFVAARVYAVQVPEPATAVLSFVGLGVVLLWRRATRCR